MKQLFGVGYTLRDRYAIQTETKQLANEHVYLVEDGAQNDEICILRQFLTPDREVARTLNRFLPEFNQITTVLHPYICQIKDAFWYEQSLCIVESQVDGKNYEEMMASHLLSESELEQWLVNLLNALSYLHKQGIYHRNISPSTIVCRSTDNTPVLTEFGVLQDLRASLSTPQNIGLLAELQANAVGLSPTPTASNDLYTLTVTGILLVTGKNVSTLYNPQTRIWEWEKYKLFSDRLTEILNRMLAPQQSDRFSSADEVLQALTSSVPSVISPAIPPLAPTVSNYYPTDFTQVPPVPQVVTLPTFDVPLYTPPESKPVQPQGWMVALGSGILVLLSGALGLAIFKSQPTSPISSQITPSPTNQIETQPLPSPSYSPTISPTPVTTSIPVSEEFSAAHAQALTQRYLNAKSSIFAPPFDRQLAAELTTGKLNREINEAINWMQANNGRYVYGFRSVGATGRIYYSSNTSAIADLRIIEQYNYYQNGREDPTQRNYYDKIIRWSFEKENGVWKISDREVTGK
jgi:serine/threonine protein kinase